VEAGGNVTTEDTESTEGDRSRRLTQGSIASSATLGYGRNPVGIRTRFGELVFPGRGNGVASKDSTFELIRMPRPIALSPRDSREWFCGERDPEGVAIGWRSKEATLPGFRGSASCIRAGTGGGFREILSASVLSVSSVVNFPGWDGGGCRREGISHEGMGGFLFHWADLQGVGTISLRSDNRLDTTLSQS